MHLYVFKSEFKFHWNDIKEKVLQTGKNNINKSLVK